MQVEGHFALVQVNRTNGCELCNGNGCGTSKLSQLFCGKPRQFQVENSINAVVGDEVVISVVEGAILRGIGVVYLLPLMLLVMGAMLGNFWAVQPEQRDGYAVIGALFGGAAGFVIAKWISLSRARSHYQPYIARRWCEE
ncbi:MAG: SoxR reducing system RseC family protein [Gallionella sp.]